MVLTTLRRSSKRSRPTVSAWSSPTAPPPPTSRRSPAPWTVSTSKRPASTTAGRWPSCSTIPGPATWPAACRGARRSGCSSSISSSCRRTRAGTASAPRSCAGPRTRPGLAVAAPPCCTRSASRPRSSTGSRAGRCSARCRAIRRGPAGSSWRRSSA